MNSFTIYYNSNCSKSREALKTLENHRIKPTIIEYLNQPLSLELFSNLRSAFSLIDFVRCNEPIFTQLKLTLENEVAVIEAMLKHPVLMQRPIITYGSQAIIARSTDKLEQFILDIKSSKY